MLKKIIYIYTFNYYNFYINSFIYNFHFIIIIIFFLLRKIFDSKLIILYLYYYYLTYTFD